MHKRIKNMSYQKRRNFLIASSLVLIFSLLSFYSFSRSAAIYRRIGNFKELKKKINHEFADSSVSFSYIVKDLKNQDLEISFNEREKFPGASLIKIPLLAVVFEAIKEEKIFLTDIVIIKKRDIWMGSGKIKNMQLPKKISLEDLLWYMITVSDNTATNKVIDILGMEYINAKFKEIGLTHTSLSRKMMDFKKRRAGIENYTTSRDVFLILERIYTKKLVNKRLSELALSLLLKQKVNDRIPLHLPKGVLVAHKTGLEKGIVHDAGIVFAPRSDYVICVLIKDADSYKEAKKIIAQVSLLTYNLYQ